MSATDALLFIDANKFLDLYRTVHGMGQLDALVEQANNIFVTQQVVDEVQRNKADCAAKFLREQFATLKQPSFDLPDHLFGVDVEQTKKIRSDKGAIVSAVKQTNDDLRALATSILEKIHQSQDEVSKALASIFDKAVSHTADELQRAKDRRDRGNPPGKNSSLGDQLSWEQVLSRFQKRLWIISRDGDYGTRFGERLFLNPFLYEELRAVNSSVEVHWFEDIPSGIKHFAEKTGVKADNLPPPEVANDIRREESDLPPLDWLDGMASLHTLPPALQQQQQRWHYLPQPNIAMPDEELPFEGPVIVRRGPTPPVD